MAAFAQKLRKKWSVFFTLQLSPQTALSTSNYTETFWATRDQLASKGMDKSRSKSPKMQAEPQAMALSREGAQTGTQILSQHTGWGEVAGQMWQTDLEHRQKPPLHHGKWYERQRGKYPPNSCLIEMRETEPNTPEKKKKKEEPANSNTCTDWEHYQIRGKCLQSDFS